MLFTDMKMILILYLYYFSSFISDDMSSTAQQHLIQMYAKFLIANIKWVFKQHSDATGGSIGVEEVIRELGIDCI